MTPEHLKMIKNAEIRPIGRIATRSSRNGSGVIPLTEAAQFALHRITLPPAI